MNEVESKVGACRRKDMNEVESKGRHLVQITVEDSPINPLDVNDSFRLERAHNL